MRAAVVAAFVAVWMAIGVALRLDADAYLLVGVPLTVAFQLGVARRPIRALWVRAAPALGWRLGGKLAAAALAVLPATGLARALAARHGVIALWMLAALVGAGAAGYAFGHLRRAERRASLPPALVATAIGVGFMLMASLHAGHAPRPWVGVTSFLRYVAVCFVLEEVTFRGALDGYAHSGASGGWATAVLISALWGLWHLPTLPRAAWHAPQIASLLIVHTGIGVPLTFAWRRAGNLAPGAVAHAFIDGVRNALVT